MKNIFKLKSTYIVLLIIVAIVIISVIKSNDEQEVFILEKRDIVREVVLVGEIRSRDFVELGFPVSGRIDKIFKKERESIRKGDPLLRLESGELMARKGEAQARLDILLAQTTTDTTIVKNIESKYLTLIKSLEQKMFSADLRAFPQQEGLGLTSPTISGLYIGKEGRYKTIVREKNSSDNYELYVFENEKVSPISLDANVPTPLGTQGLFLEFTQDLNPYRDTIWYVSIPNTAGSNYVKNRTAYEDALVSRDEELSRARSGLGGNDPLRDARIAEARASLASLDAQIRERTIYATFSGTISYLDKKEGEIVSAGATVVSLRGDEAEKIVALDVPEIDAPYISKGLPIKAKLDAFSEVEIEGEIYFIDPVSTEVSGISVYQSEVTLFLPEDISILDGMTAEVSIELSRNDQVLALPLTVISYDKEGSYVMLQKVDTEVKKYIKIGGESSDGYVHVLEGLTLGDIVVSIQ
ncbi:MAG: RND family efflux transporter MFP subunit [Flavobacteriaceae bacterium]|jgi:RND family efflux transporter MFP subunit